MSCYRGIDVVHNQQYPGMEYCYHSVLSVWLRVLYSTAEPTYPDQRRAAAVPSSTPAASRPAATSAVRPEELIYNQREAWDYYLKYTKVISKISYLHTSGAKAVGTVL